MPRLDAQLILEAPSLRRAKDQATRGVLTAAVRAVRSTTRNVEQALEAATKEAVPGRLWRAWKSETYPRRGIAREPVGIIFVNGGRRSRGAMEFQTRPGRIAGGHGQFLAIPTPAAGSRGRGRDLTPGEFERRTGQRLRFIYRRNGPSLLVAEGVLSARGTFRQITRRRTQADARRGFQRGTTTVVVFILVPQVAFANRFAVEPIVRRGGGRLDEEFIAELRRLPEDGRS